MFEHLDDSSVPVFGADARALAIRVGRRRKSLRYLRNATAVICAVGMLSVGAYGSGLLRLTHIQRVNVASTNSVADGQPTTFVIIGSDARPPGRELDGSRADTIMVVRTNPAAGTAAILSIPRDLLVQPGEGIKSTWVSGTPEQRKRFEQDQSELSAATGAKYKINSMLDSEDPSALVAVLESELKIPVDHVVIAGFDGFTKSVDAIDGIRVSVQQPLRDKYSDLRLQPGSCQKLNGSQALDLVRARHLEQESNGRWSSGESLGDLDRIRLQQMFIVSVMSRLREMSLNPVQLEQLASAIADNLKLDSKFSNEEVLATARFIAGLDASRISVQLLPTQSAMEDGASVQVMAPGADDVIRRLVSGEALEPAPSSVPGSGQKIDQLVSPC